MPPNLAITASIGPSLVAALNFRGTGQVNVDKIMVASLQCEQMQGHLLRAFAATENVVNQLMLRIIKPSSSRREFLDAWFVRSSLLTLESKKKCVLEWADRSEYFTRAEKSGFDKLFRSFIQRRNMVVHGSAYADDLYDLWLDYFEGSPKTQKLCKEFSDKCVAELLELQKLLRAFDQSIYQKDKIATATPPELSKPTALP